VSGNYKNNVVGSAPDTVGTGPLFFQKSHDPFILGTALLFYGNTVGIGHVTRGRGIASFPHFIGNERKVGIPLLENGNLLVAVRWLYRGDGRGGLFRRFRRIFIPRLPVRIGDNDGRKGG